MSVLKMLAGVTRVPTIPGQALFSTYGSYTWVCPEGVNTVCVVCIGPGGHGIQSSTQNAAGSGGGLGWKNDIPVTPGVSYDVQVGRGLQYTQGPSYFISTEVVAGLAGSTSISEHAGGGYVGDGGGNGGGADRSGGGGAGGYTGNGGDGGDISTLATNGAGGGGGGGGGGGVNDAGGGGGGVYPYGEGSSGAAGTDGDGGDGGGGYGGSGGENGLKFILSSNSADGGAYGGGGGGAGNDNPTGEAGEGGDGCVRIIWGDNRAFPSTNTGDV